MFSLFLLLFVGYMPSLYDVGAYVYIGMVEPKSDISCLPSLLMALLTKQILWLNPKLTIQLL